MKKSLASFVASSLHISKSSIEENYYICSKLSFYGVCSNIHTTYQHNVNLVEQNQALGQDGWNWTGSRVNEKKNSTTVRDFYRHDVIKIISIEVQY